MNIVITGGTGFIGQAIADVYIKAGHHVFVTGHEAPVPGADYQALIAPFGRPDDLIQPTTEAGPPGGLLTLLSPLSLETESLEVVLWSEAILMDSLRPGSLSLASWCAA
jgi:NAD(P)-dependent dehydrogenase (short-subunit alcohol dehydrogenase family)